MTQEEDWNLHYLETAEKSFKMKWAEAPKFKDKISDFATKVEKLAHEIVLENKLALSIKKMYYEYALIQKEKWLSFIKDSKKTSEKCDP